MANESLLPQILSLHGRWRADRPALATPDECLDWRTLDRRVNQVANGLIAAGCGRGVRVGVVMSNGAPMIEIMLGVMKAGAAVAPLNTSIPDAGLDAMLADADVDAVFATPEHGRRLFKSWTKPSIRISAPSGIEPTLSEGWTDYRSWRDGQSAHDPTVPLTREDLCSIIYSSGTTGRPKGIAHSHRARLDWSHDLAHALRYHDNARTLISTGLYSNISWASMLPTLLLGGTLFVRSGFDAADVLETIARERITHMAMVPVQYQRLLDHPAFGDFDRSSMHAMMCCGSPLHIQTKEALFDAFACGVIELYGSTEGIITTLSPEEARSRMNSVGRPPPGEDIAILSENDQPLEWGQTGEIVALSRFAMSGYWRNEDATREALWIDGQGRRWLRSGDIGRIDDAGFLHITDRKKDMIISGGQNVYPADIESVLMGHPDVADCAVFGVPSERWGETPLALAVLHKSAGTRAEEIRDWANARLGKQQRVSAIEVRQFLPRNANGKLLKRDLRAPYWSGADGGTS